MSVRLKNLKTNKYICYKPEIEHQVFNLVRLYKISTYCFNLFLVYFMFTLYIGLTTLLLYKHNIDFALFVYLKDQMGFTILFLICIDLYFWYKSKDVCYRVNYVFNKNIRENDKFEYVDDNGLIIRTVDIPIGFIECSMSEIANLYYKFKNINGKYKDLLEIKL